MRTRSMTARGSNSVDNEEKLHPEVRHAWSMLVCGSLSPSF
jgi:hypothetical protein